MIESIHEGTSAVITNLSTSAWATIFGAAEMTIAFLDRLGHHCHILETGAEGLRSYWPRMREAMVRQRYGRS